MNKINNFKKKPLMMIRDNSDDSTLDNKIEAYQKAIVFNRRLVHSDRTPGGAGSSNHLGSTAYSRDMGRWCITIKGLRCMTIKRLGQGVSVRLWVLGYSLGFGFEFRLGFTCR